MKRDERGRRRGRRKVCCKIPFSEAEDRRSCDHMMCEVMATIGRQRCEMGTCFTQNFALPIILCFTHKSHWCNTKSCMCVCVSERVCEREVHRHTERHTLQPHNSINTTSHTHSHNHTHGDTGTHKHTHTQTCTVKVVTH